jgi:lipopolysaccharide assembly outer membrane protein LptD (OstA)
MKRAIFAAFILSLVVVGITAFAHAQSNMPTGKATFDKMSANNDTVTYTGHVSITVNGVTLRADEAVFTRATGDLELRGSVHATLPK